MTQQLAHVDRRAAIARVDDAAGARVDRLTELAERGLAAAYVPETCEVAQTVRGLGGNLGVRVERQGTNLRYAAMAALGLSRLPLDRQRQVLAGASAMEVVERAAIRARTSTDAGAVALSAWAQAEVAGHHDAELFRRLDEMLQAGGDLATVDVAWALTASVAASGLGDTDDVVTRSTALLRRHVGAVDLYPHVLGHGAPPRWRAHVASFADQVYPLQAHARASVLTGDRELLHAAERTAQRLVDLQGRAGQWWWHYDVRDATVVERYPVYSVHQHAMAPMALLDLLEAGGTDHREAVARGLAWLDSHPEVVEELVSDRFDLVWRKVGRREPRKVARAVAAVTTGIRPGVRVPGVDRLMPAVVVDHECRPYELGWLLHAWLPTPAAATALRTAGDAERGDDHA